MILAGILVAWRLPKETRKSVVAKDKSWRSRVARLDLFGAILLAATVGSFLLTLNITSTTQPSTPLWILGTALITLAFGTSFVISQKRRSQDGILPLRLFSYHEIRTAYTVVSFQYGASYSVRVPPLLLHHETDIL